MKKHTITFLLVLLLLAAFISAAAAYGSYSDDISWKTYPLNGGDGVYVPCASGLIAATVDDGMATVICINK